MKSIIIGAGGGGSLWQAMDVAVNSSLGVSKINADLLVKVF